MDDIRTHINIYANNIHMIFVVEHTYMYKQINKAPCCYSSPSYYQMKEWMVKEEDGKEPAKRLLQKNFIHDLCHVHTTSGKEQ